MNELQVSAANQFFVFLCSVLLGCALRFLYAVAAAVRRVTRPKRATVFIADVTFSFVSAIITYLFMLVCCHGKVRVYVLVGEAVGFLLFGAVAAKPVKRAVTAVLTPVIKAVCALKNKIILPLFRKIEKGAKIVKKHLKRRLSVLYNYSVFGKIKAGRMKKHVTASAEKKT